jgi:hypothetical protein
VSSKSKGQIEQRVAVESQAWGGKAAKTYYTPNNRSFNSVAYLPATGYWILHS